MSENNYNSNSSPTPRRRARKRRVTAGGIAAMFFKVLGTILLIGLCTGAIMACFAVVYVKTVIIPQTDQVLSTIELFDVNQSSTMYYVDKYTGAEVEMLTLYKSEDRVWVEYDDIPQNLVNATIAIEDKRFRSHAGVDWIRTGYGVLSMFAGKDIQGGSTLTQQLIKNLTNYNEVTVKRKILEIFTALEYEKSHSKDEILEWYLNYIYLDDGCNGVYSAAQNYYGKELNELTLAECASLISITNNPSLYNPYRHPENNLERRNLVLEQMCKQGMISEAERDAAKAEPLNLKRAEGTAREEVIYTWYEDQVINDVISDLMDRYGLSKQVATDMLYQGGLRIETCFDPEVQAYVDAVYQDRSCLVLDSKTGQEIQSAITVVDNQTGNVVALSGGIGEKDRSRAFNRATATVRPPGSSIKPLAVYAPALEMDMLTPATVYDDTPIDWEGAVWPSNSYNYYQGLTTVYDALTNSVNTIAVKVLLNQVTLNYSYQFLEDRFGITSLEPGREVNGEIKTDLTPAALALGGMTDGVSTYEMAAAYAAFANNGMYKAPRTYLQVTAVDSNGGETILLDNSAVSEPVLKESTVYYMNTMLKNVIQSGTGHDARFQSVSMTIAGKTGTTTSNNDKWFVGYSPYYTAAVWVGYDQQERINSGEYLAAQLWRKVMEPLHAGLEDKDFYAPDNLVTQYYCKDSGMIPTEYCSLDPRGSRVVQGVFVDGDQPVGYCTVHTPQEICLDAPILDDTGSPTGLYYAAGEFCPEESRSTVALLNYDRIRVSDSVYTRDDAYLASVIRELCPIHTEAAEPLPFDPDDPATWPEGFDPSDPSYDPEDPTTWPGYEPSEPEPDEPDEPDDPDRPPAVSPSDEPAASSPGTTEPPQPSMPPIPSDDPAIESPLPSGAESSAEPAVSSWKPPGGSPASEDVFGG